MSTVIATPTTTLSSLTRSPQQLIQLSSKKVRKQIVVHIIIILNYRKCNFFQLDVSWFLWLCMLFGLRWLLNQMITIHQHGRERGYKVWKENMAKVPPKWDDPLKNSHGKECTEIRDILPLASSKVRSAPIVIKRFRQSRLSLTEPQWLAVLPIMSRILGSAWGLKRTLYTVHKDRTFFGRLVALLDYYNNYQEWPWRGVIDHYEHLRFTTFTLTGVL